LPVSTAAGQPVDGLVLDLDASIVICHSEKESATRTWKKSFGFHPLFCFLDGSREALSGLLREGRAGSNTTADHITVLDAALVQIPDAHRYGTDILIRSDSAGCTQGFPAHIRSLREHGIDTFFSVGVAITEPTRDAIRNARDWIPALDTDGDLRDGAEICEITGLVPDDGYPQGTRFIVRRERPRRHPAGQIQAPVDRLRDRAASGPERQALQATVAQPVSGGRGADDLAGRRRDGRCGGAVEVPLVLLLFLSGEPPGQHEQRHSEAEHHGHAGDHGQRDAQRTAEPKPGVIVVGHRAPPFNRLTCRPGHHRSGWLGPWHAPAGCPMGHCHPPLTSG
jgi:hypothetical protein